MANHKLHKKPEDALLSCGQSFLQIDHMHGHIWCIWNLLSPESENLENIDKCYNKGKGLYTE